MIRRFTLRSVFVMLLALFFGQPMHLFAQNEEKLSAATYFFLKDRDAKKVNKPAIKVKDITPDLDLSTLDLKGKRIEPLYAKPDTIDGKVYMSSFVRLENENSTSALEAKGVIVQGVFNNGLITALIPVDSIESVATIANVKKVSVGRRMSILTKKARTATNADDVLTQSPDAIAEGLTKKYDGTGVILGVIDTGIDFQHIAFKDKNGNSRIKQAYVYNGSKATEYTSITSSSPTTDDSAEDHGTHTSSTAGGSSVIISGSTVTVTDDHSSATYGGMAPGADLYLAGINGLADTYLANAFQKICNYADQQGKPVVVSNSWGASVGPRDGTGDMADVVKTYFGDSHPNHICLFASSNDAGNGGMYFNGTSSSSNPVGSVIMPYAYNGSNYYLGVIGEAWTRTSSSATMMCKVMTINKTTGSVVNTATVTPTANGASVSLSGVSGLYAIKETSSSGRTGCYLYAYGNGNGYISVSSNYYLAVQFYPSSGSSMVDVWCPSGYNHFSNTPSTSGYTWTAGTDDSSICDEATISDVIAVGAYVSSNSVTDYNGTSHSLSSVFPTIGDIAYFSSYQVAGQGASQAQLPWITAPGATIVSAVNHYDTSGDFSYINGNSAEYDMYRVNANTTNPYGSMEGTSMATPVAAGIVALWLQAAKEVGKNMTVNDIKEVMKETAIKDAYTTTGANASHFGQGKIDALAGIKYILGASTEPTIKTDKTEVAFEGYATKTYTQTVTVTGLNLEGNITVSKSGSNVFSVDKTNISAANAANGVELTITYAPTTAGTQTGTITLSSSNAENVTISLTGTAEAATPTIIADKETLEFSAILDKEVTQTINVSGRFLTENVTATLNDANGVFAINDTSFEVTEDGVTIPVTFSSAEEGTFVGTLLLVSAGAASVTINLSATARDGGTASDSYLNLAKYSTIAEAGWNTTLVNTLYKYTEYEDDEVAWLTMPVYGGFVGAKYAINSTTIGSGQPQKWVESNIETSNYSGTDWSATDVLLGSGSYFTGTTGNGRARALGTNSSTNTSAYTTSFYVTNITAVKLLGLGRSGVTSSYPAYLNVYECNFNADGTLTASSTATKIANSTSTSTSTPFNIMVNDLDASKIYKVVAGQYRGYLYEIGFQTPIEVDKTPRLSATPTEIVFDSIYATTEMTKTFVVSGKYLEDEVSISVSDENEAFSVDKTTISIDETTNGAEVTVTFHPSEAGEFTGSITLSSAGTEDVVITLSGTAEPAIPTILVDNQALTFSGNIDSEQSQAFTVTGRFINSDVNLTLTDANRVFSVSPAMLSAEAIAAGAEVTITFNASQEGTYTGMLTLSSEGAEPVTIQLSASANNGGTASDPFLNIAKYATIDEAGWNTALVDVLYKYTEYEEDEVAWLTLPVYGAWVGTYYNNHPQKWIESNVADTRNKYAGTTWSSNGELLGSSPYFTSASARAMGYNSRTNSTKETFSFYVSNTTAVKLLGLGQSKTNSTYPATLKVYECEVSADGTPVASSTALQSYSNSATSGTFTLSATNLDATKVYKIEAATYRSYLCEIGFQTSLKKPVQLGDVNNDGEITIADVTALVNIVLGKDAEGAYNHSAADVNQDNDITIADVTALVNRLLGK